MLTRWRARRPLVLALKNVNACLFPSGEGIGGGFGLETHLGVQSHFFLVDSAKLLSVSCAAKRKEANVDG